MTALKDLQSHARKSGAPGTYVLIGAFVASFLLSWLSKDGLFVNLVFFSDGWQLRPWTILTYPFAISGASLIGVLFSCLWLYWMGTSVEREIGTARYIAFFFAMALIPLAMIWLGNSMLGRPTLLSDPYLAIAGVTVAWATRNPNATILLAMIIPVPAWFLGCLTAALIIFGYGFGAPLLGVFAALHLGLAYLYAANKIAFLPWGMARGTGTAKRQLDWERKRDDKYFDDVRRREQDREERERLRKLFESSMKDDGPDQ